MPRGLGRGLRRGGSTDAVPLSWLLVTVLIVAVVGWLQLSRFEERLHAARTQRAGDEGAASQRPAHELQSLHRAAHEAALQDRRQPSAAQLCAAVLEAAGILPDSEGRRVGVGGALAVEDGRAVMQAEAEGREGAVAAAAVAHLQSRRKLYDAMEASLLEKGLALASETTQGLGLGDMFTRDPASGALRPVLEELQVPVRAVVLPLTDAAASKRLEAAVARHLAPLLPKHGMWAQNSSLFHSTVYHASTHFDPVPAGPAQVNEEEDAIRAVGSTTCPLRVVLERVVATPSGTVLACWQVSGGTDVYELRRRLAEALPGASKKQVVQDGSILHTTLARLVTSPRLGSSSGDQQQEQQERQGDGGGDAMDAEAAVAAAEEAAVLLQAAVEKMTSELCGLQAVLDRLWFAEEYHKLALALGGRFRARPVPLRCGLR